MVIPGANVLKMAFRVIAKVSVSYKQVTGRTLNSLGKWEPQYNTITLKGSLQPIPKSFYQQMGLDLQKSYFTLYVPSNVIDVGRDTSGDQFIFQGNLYQCMSENDWFPLDGWTGVVSELVGPANAG